MDPCYTKWLEYSYLGLTVAFPPSSSGEPATGEYRHLFSFSWKYSTAIWRAMYSFILTYDYSYVVCVLYKQRGAVGNSLL